MTRPAPRRSSLAGSSPVAPPVPDQDLEPTPEPRSSSTEPDPIEAPQAVTQPQTKPKTAKRAAAARAGESETTRIGVYLTTEEFDDAKAAYLADWNHGGSADTFARWIGATIEKHAQRTATQRAEQARPRARAAESTGYSRSFVVPASAAARMRAAITADQQAGRFPSDSAWCGDAISLAVDAARVQNGGRLPTPPARLPNQLKR